MTGNIFPMKYTLWLVFGCLVGLAILFKQIKLDVVSLFLILLSIGFAILIIAENRK